jgi:hypothetical protein
VDGIYQNKAKLTVQTHFHLDQTVIT